MDFNIKNGESYVPVDVDRISVSDVDMSTVQSRESKKEIGLSRDIYYMYPFNRIHTYTVNAHKHKYTICIYHTYTMYIPHVLI